MHYTYITEETFSFSSPSIYYQIEKISSQEAFISVKQGLIMKPHERLPQYVIHKFIKRDFWVLGLTKFQNWQMVGSNFQIPQKQAKWLCKVLNTPNITGKSMKILQNTSKILQHCHQSELPAKHEQMKGGLIQVRLLSVILTKEEKGHCNRRNQRRKLW